MLQTKWTRTTTGALMKERKQTRPPQVTNNMSPMPHLPERAYFLWDSAIKVVQKQACRFPTGLTCAVPSMRLMVRGGGLPCQEPSGSAWPAVATCWLTSAAPVTSPPPSLLPRIAAKGAGCKAGLRFPGNSEGHLMQHHEPYRCRQQGSR